MTADTFEMLCPLNSLRKDLHQIQTNEFYFILSNIIIHCYNNRTNEKIVYYTCKVQC